MDDGTIVVAKRYKPVFESPWEEYQDRNGQSFDVLRVIDTPDETIDPECLPMYRIRFPDGTVIDAWPEEVDADVSWRIGVP